MTYCRRGSIEEAYKLDWVTILVIENIIGPWTSYMTSTCPHNVVVVLPFT